MTTNEPSLTTFPMHGQHKLSNEGYRTRDGHLIEWFGKKLHGEGEVLVLSRPEPTVLAPLRRFTRGSVATNTIPISAPVWKLPRLGDRQRWWVDSLPYYDDLLPEICSPIITWNPFVSISSIWPKILLSGQPIAFDLLDDWSIHFAFQGISEKVEDAYRELFKRADIITANAEGTAELAKRFGRNDVTLLPNGCDPDRFSVTSNAAGPPTVGYVGKIGRRLDLELVIQAAHQLPHVKFVFAGPVLDREYRKPMAAAPNITLLGDVHYRSLPDLLSTFDIGWVPHNVGAGEVGGDVIKTYEYRATGLPVLTTPVSGSASRGLDAVTVAPRQKHVEHLREMTSRGPRVPRVVSELQKNVRWEGKAIQILDRLGVPYSHDTPKLR